MVLAASMRKTLVYRIDIHEIAEFQPKIRSLTILSVVYLDITKVLR